MRCFPPSVSFQALPNPYRCRTTGNVAESFGKCHASLSGRQEQQGHHFHAAVSDYLGHEMCTERHLMLSSGRTQVKSHLTWIEVAWKAVIWRGRILQRLEECVALDLLSYAGLRDSRCGMTSCSSSFIAFGPLQLLDLHRNASELCGIITNSIFRSDETTLASLRYFRDYPFLSG